jgi:hypothetical protein
MDVVPVRQGLDKIMLINTSEHTDTVLQHY